MARVNIAARKLICIVLIVVCMAPMVGCVGLVANLLNAAGAGLMPAAFSGLKGKKVAVICVSNSDFGPTSTSGELNSRINRLLTNYVKDIEVISNQDVADWIDRNNWDMIDFISAGRGVGAEMVVAIDLNSFSLYDGKTMYKGRAQVDLVVYDVVTGNEVFAKSPPEIAYPTNAGIFATETSEREFRKHFLDALARRIARNFFAFDMNDDVANDAKVVSHI